MRGKGSREIEMQQFGNIVPKTQRKSLNVVVGLLRKRGRDGAEGGHLLNGNESWSRQFSRSNLASPLFFQVKCEAKLPLHKTKNNNSNCKKGSSEDKSKVSVGEECRADEQAFLVALYKYMKERKTPIERIPYLGFKQSK